MSRLRMLDLQRQLDLTLEPQRYFTGYSTQNSSATLHAGLNRDGMVSQRSMHYTGVRFGIT